MKRFRNRILFLCFSAALLAVLFLFTADRRMEAGTKVTADSNWPSNATDANGNYVIYNAADLLAFANLSKTDTFAGKTIILANNITFNSDYSTAYSKWVQGTQTATNNFPGIGHNTRGSKADDDTAFSGTFDGKNYTIYGIYESYTSRLVGLFTHINGKAVIKNLKLSHSYFSSNTLRVGCIAACAAGGTIQNVTVDNSYLVHTKSNSTGGIVGHAWGATISDSTFGGTISVTATTEYIGGILGYGTTEFGNTIKNCTFSGTITVKTGANSIGGIFGGRSTNAGTDKIQGCVVTGTINGGSRVGGIMGEYSIEGDKWTEISDCRFEGIMKPSGGFSGGVVAYVDGQGNGVTIERTSVSGEIIKTITSGQGFGGFIGGIPSGCKAVISECEFTGYMEIMKNAGSTEMAGCFCGLNDGDISITNALSSGTITVKNGTDATNNNIGGIIGLSRDGKTELDSIIVTTKVTGSSKAVGTIIGATINNTAANSTYVTMSSVYAVPYVYRDNGTETEKVYCSDGISFATRTGGGTQNPVPAYLDFTLISEKEQGISYYSSCIAIDLRIGEGIWTLTSDGAPRIRSVSGDLDSNVKFKVYEKSAVQKKNIYGELTTTKISQLSLNSTYITTAPSYTYYSFLGWTFGKLNSEGILVHIEDYFISEEETLSITDMEELFLNYDAENGGVYLIALYEPIEDPNLYLNVHIQGSFTVNGTPYQNSAEVLFTEGTDLTVTYTGNDTFLGWYNASGYVLGTGKTITFKGSKNLLTVNGIIGNPGDSVVIFLSSGNRIISEGAYTQISSSFIKSLSSSQHQVGNDFGGWEITVNAHNKEYVAVTDGNVTNVTNRINQLIGTGRIVARAYFKTRMNESYQVRLHNIIIRDPLNFSVSRPETYDTISVTDYEKPLYEFLDLTTEESIEGAPFIGYYDGDGQCLSEQNELMYRIPITGAFGDIYAVYSRTDISEKDDAAVHFTHTRVEQDFAGTDTYYLTATYSVSEEYTVKEAGILLCLGSLPAAEKANAAKTVLLLEQKGVTISKKSNPNRVDNYTLVVNSVSRDRALFARAYIIAEDTAGEEAIFYSLIAYGDTNGMTIEKEPARSAFSELSVKEKLAYMVSDLPVPKGYTDSVLLDSTEGGTGNTGSGFHDISNGNYVYTFGNVSDTDYNAYITALTNAGFTLRSRDTVISSSKVSVLKKTDRTVILNRAGTNITVYVTIFGDSTAWTRDELFVGVPLPSTGVTYDETGEGEVMAYFTGNNTKFASLISGMKANGFTSYASSSAGTNGSLVSANTLVSEVRTVVVTYAEKEGKIYVAATMWKALSEHLQYKDSYVEGNVNGAETKLHVLPTHRTNASTLWSGNSFVLQLKNGHFIIVDGGREVDAPLLIQYLKDHSEGTPIIEGWFFSHMHADHSGAFNTIIRNAKYHDQIYVQGIYISGCESRALILASSFQRDQTDITYLAGTYLRDEKGNPTVTYRVSAGQRYYFNDLYVDVPLTQAYVPVTSRTTDINDTSTWLMFHINGARWFTAGDADSGSITKALAWYDETYFTVDVHTSFHHGLNLGNKTMRNAIKAKILLLTAHGEEWFQLCYDDNNFTNKTTLTNWQNNWKAQRALCDSFYCYTDKDGKEQVVEITFRDSTAVVTKGDPGVIKLK